MKKYIVYLLLFVALNTYAGGGYVQQYSSATSGTFTCQDTGQDIYLIHDAGLTLTFTIAFPATPFNGQRVRIASAGGMTALSLTTVTGTISNLLTSMASGGCAEYTFNTAQNKWFRSI